MADRAAQTALAKERSRLAAEQRTTLIQLRDSARAGAESQRLIELDVTRTDRGAVLTLEGMMFTNARADLKVGATEKLDQLATYLKEYRDRAVTIEGHTDSAGASYYNTELSQLRAESVKAYLVQQGVGSLRITAIGKGETSPIADNDSQAGRNRNRRVEISIGEPALVTK